MAILSRRLPSDLSASSNVNIACCACINRKLLGRCGADFSLPVGLGRLKSAPHLHSFSASQRDMKAPRKNIGNREWGVGNGEWGNNFLGAHSPLPTPHSRLCRRLRLKKSSRTEFREKNFCNQYNPFSAFVCGAGLKATKAS